MSVVRLGADDLLEYNATYKVLVCRQCRYAIQKNALESHLLRHKIYRGDRQRLLSSIARFELLEPDEVPLPAPGSPAVDGLPTLSGFRCMATGCSHLTVSSKRMKRHWTTFHKLDGSVPLSSSLAVPVGLQTFFRGSKVRYFEVMPTDFEGPRAAVSEDVYRVPDERQDTSATSNVTPSPDTGHVDHHGAVDSTALVNLNLESMTYFHHFFTVTSSTLPDPKNPHASGDYWQTWVVNRALQLPWLMYGILAISARHLAVLADDNTVQITHHDRELQYSDTFENMTACALSLENVEVDHETFRAGEQIKYILHCAQWASVTSAFDFQSVAPLQLSLIVSTIRGCIAAGIVSRDIVNGGSDQGLQNRMATQKPRQSRSYTHKGSRTDVPSNTLPPNLLDRLRKLPFQLARRIGKPETPSDVFTILSAITGMVECCTVSYASDDPRTACHSAGVWLTSIPDQFNQLISNHHPGAMVLVAHWATLLLKRAEDLGCWFLKGSARIIVLQAITHLSESGRDVLDLVEHLIVMVSE